MIKIGATNMCDEINKGKCNAWHEHWSHLRLHIRKTWRMKNRRKTGKTCIKISLFVIQLLFLTFTHPTRTYNVSSSIKFLRVTVQVMYRSINQVSKGHHHINGSARGSHPRLSDIPQHLLSIQWGLVHRLSINRTPSYNGQANGNHPGICNFLTMPWVCGGG